MTDLLSSTGQPISLPDRFEAWFAGRGWAPRRHQLDMVQAGMDGAHALLIAPTGGGKTLAGFLPSLIELSQRPPPNTPRGVHTLYISPLKALAVDVERNLMTPIAQMGLNVTAESRTGDTGEARKQRQRIKPPDILLTTPEQLALFCAWEGARLYFEDLRCVIIDEIHSLWPQKRGDLLALDIARLQQFAPSMRRVGLSATVDDPDMIRRWLSPVPPPSGEVAAAQPLTEGVRSPSQRVNLIEAEPPVGTPSTTPSARSPSPDGEELQTPPTPSASSAGRPAPCPRSTS